MYVECKNKPKRVIAKTMHEEKVKMTEKFRKDESFIIWQKQRKFVKWMLLEVLV